MTYSEHMRWAKSRAREYLKAGDPKNAIVSILSDLTKHPETAHLTQVMWTVGMASITNLADATKFVEGFTE